MLLCTSICIRTYVSKDSLLSLCVTGMDVSRDDHWGHDLIAQSLFSGSYNLSSPETLSWHKSPVLLLSGADGPSAGRFLPWVAVASLRKGMWRTSTPVDWHVLTPADSVSLTFFLSLKPGLDLGIPPLLPLHITGLHSHCDYPFASCFQIPARTPPPLPRLLSSSLPFSVGLGPLSNPCCRATSQRKVTGSHTNSPS